MAERIGGISIGLDLESAGIKRQLSDIRRSFRMFDGELRTNMNNFRNNARSVESYEKNITNLNKTIKNQEKNLSDLNLKREEAIKTDGAHSKKVQDLTIDINKQADSLNYYRHQLSKTKKELADFQHEQNIANSKFTKTAEALDKGSKGLETFGNNAKRVGGGLTKYITAPILGIGTALASMTAGLGVKRLMAIDQAQAKLRGLGHSVKDIEKYSETVKTAVDGTLLTFAEGMDITAGGLAVGIKEGKEMERYIKMIGNASAATGREAGETAQIFNRIVGGGKVMTEELNQIEHGMPGFTKAMAEHLKVPQEEFRKMVTEGKVSSDEFLVVMENFSGNLSEEYAKTFSGMYKNTMARIGKFGERVMGEAYDEVKDVLFQFSEMLKSPEIAEFGDKLGQKIGHGLKVAIGYITNVIDWFKNLDGATKELFGKIALGAVVAGPLIATFGSIALVSSKLIGAFTPLFVGLGKLSGGFTTVVIGAKTFGAVFPKLGAVLGVLTGPIGITVGIIAALSAAFIIAYKKSETFRSMIDGIVDRFKIAMDWASQFKDGINAVIDMFKGDWLGGRDMLQRLGLTPEQILAIENFVISVQMIIHNLKETFKKVFGEISTFVKGIFNDFKIWWDADGALIISALGTVFRDTFTVIKDVVKIGFDVVMNIFNTVLPIIKGLWDTFWPLIKMTVVNTWNAMKLIIGVSMDLIRGIISAVSAMIQGDWSRVWAIIKDTVVSIWNRIKTYITDSINNIKNTVGQKVQELKNNFVNKLQEMWNGTKEKFSGMYTTAKNKVIDMKNSVVHYITQMKDNAMKKFDDLVAGAKALPGKMKDALIAGKNKVADGIKSLGNSMASTLGKVVNGVIGGINTVMSKIGIKKSISQWSVPAFSRGTGQGSPSGRLTRNGKIAMDTLATVGDKGPGNGKGTRELVHYPNGQVGLYDKDATIFAPKGTTIFNNKQTEELLGQLPKFSKGTGFWGNIKNIASKAFDYLTNPSKIFNAIVDNYMQAWNVGAFAKDLGKGAWKNMKSGLLEWVKARFSEAGAGKRQAWMDRYPITTPYSPFSAVPGYPRAFNGGRHYGIDWGTPNNVNLTSPVAGTVSRQSDHGGGNVARVDYGKGSMYFLHMNSVKPGKVGIGQSLGYSGNTGAFTTGPHVHVQDENPKTSFLQNRNTRNPLKMIKSHFNGGLIKTAGLFNLHPNEYVVPMDNPTNAMKLIAHMSKELAGKSKQTNQLPNLMPRDNNRVEEKLDVMIELLSKLLDKPTDIHLNGKKMNDEFNEMNAIDAIMNF